MTPSTLMNLLSKLIAAVVSVGAIAAPASAYTQAEYNEHVNLWKTIQSVGVRTYLNPKEDCQPENGNRVHGWYAADKTGAYQKLIVCQDNAIPGGMQVKWTPNDLDTLRHEAWHLVQDCIDGKRDFSLNAFYDGSGPGPGTLTLNDVVAKYGYERSQDIAHHYRTEMNASQHIINMEIEAFAAAEIIPANAIANLVRKICR